MSRPLPPAQRKVAELLKPGDIVTYGGGATRYVIRSIHHVQKMGRWETTIVAGQEWNEPKGAAHYFQEARLVHDFIWSSYPGGVVKKIDGGAS